MKETYVKVLPNSKLGTAIEYTYSLLPRLSRYVNDGHFNIDSNLIENAIRPLALGKKNYLFCGNDATAYRAAIVHSLISTRKTADIDPRTWMEDVLRKIPYYQHDRRNLAELLPYNWKNETSRSHSLPTRTNLMLIARKMRYGYHRGLTNNTIFIYNILGYQFKFSHYIRLEYW